MIRVVVLCGELISFKSGGLATSIPKTVAALETIPDLAVHVIGARDTERPDDYQKWGNRVRALEVSGPRAFRWMPKLASTLDEINPDVVDVQGLWTYASLANLSRHQSSGKLYMITPRGMLDPWALRNSKWRKRIVSCLFEDRHLQSAYCLRATAPIEADHFRALGLKQPIAVIPNGVDVPDYQDRQNKNGANRTLLFLSRLHPKKGLSYLLRSWSELARRHPNWRLVIAGVDERGHENDMKRLARNLKLPRVVWLGPIFGEAKAALYRSSDVLVLPTHAENFANVIAEALAHGLPVVTTRNAPWHGLISNQCGWWVPLDLPSLTGALNQSMSVSDGERQAMGKRGYVWMQREFSWHFVATQLAQVYRWIAGGDSPPDCVRLG